MIHIEFNPDLQINFTSEILKRAADMVLAHQSVDGDLTIVLTDDAQLRELNKTYLDIDAPTDVLSFPASETAPETGRRYLGDILISVQRSEAQASAAGHPLVAEIQLLVVHGALHLLGHDHVTEEEKARMWHIQAEVLAKLGLSEIEIRET